MTEYPEHQQVVDAANTIASKITTAQREALERILKQHES